MSLLNTPLARQKGTLRAGMICAGAAALAAVSLLGVAGWFLVGTALAGAAGPLAVYSFNYLLPSTAIRATAILRTGARYGERMLGHRAALFALADLRMDLFARVAKAALTGRVSLRGGEMAARFGRDVDLLEDAAIRSVAIVGGWTAGLVALAMTSLLGWRSALSMGLGMAIMRLASRIMAGSLPPLQAQLAQAHAAMQADYADLAGPAADIAVYGLAPRMTAALETCATTQVDAEQALACTEARLLTVQTAIASLAVALVAALAQGAAPIIALGLLSAMAGMEAWAALAQHDMRQSDLDAAEGRLAMIGQARAFDAAPLPDHAEITIQGQILSAGARIAITGPSGIGKTLLIETLVGLRDDAPQDVRIAGRAPGCYGLDALRPLFALMQQDTPLIAGSVADNLDLARPGLTREDMERALHVTCADTFVAALPDGLNQWLGGDGARLSGGQRRRIALARALLAGRPWLVLDEPSEGLDTATESRLVERLGAWLDETGTGLILISHRPAMLALTDRAFSL